MRRALKVLAWGVGGLVLLAVLAVSGIFITANTATGRAWVERLTFKLTSGNVRLVGLNGSFPSHLTLAQLQLIDQHGVWLSAEQISVTWSIWELLSSQIYVDDLKAAHVDMERTPYSSAPPSKTEPSIPHITVMHLDIARIDLGAALVGSPAALAASGGFEMRSLQNARADIVASRIDKDGNYQVRLRIDRKRIDANIKLMEPASGPLENLLGLPGLGALDATLNVSGLRSAEQIDLALAAGDLHVRVQGNLDLVKLGGDLQYSLASPALTPRPDISWQNVSLQGRFHGTLKAPSADGELEVDGLRVGAALELAKLAADLSTDGTKLVVKSVTQGLRLPGPNRDLLVKTPLKLDGSVRFDDASRPVDVTATHPLFALHLQAATAPQLDGTIELKIPEIAVFAALAGEEARGQAVIKGKVAVSDRASSVALDAGFIFTGGDAQLLKLLGKRPSLQIVGDMDDSAFHIASLRLSGDPLSFSANGTATRAAPAAPQAAAAPNSLNAVIKDIQVQWEIGINKLGVLSDSLGGSLKASGRLDGTPSALTANADLSSNVSVRGSPPGTITAAIRARGLPARPTGSVEAHGVLDGAPLKVDISVERANDGALHGIIHAAEWKSLHADGEVSATDVARAHGALHAHFEQLADLNRLLGTALAGELDANAAFKPQAGQTVYQLDLDAKNVAINSVAGNLQLKATGPLNALAVDVAAQLPDLQGAPLHFTSSEILNVDARRIEVQVMSADFRGLTAKLSAPAQVIFGDGLQINQLNIAAADAQLHLDGRLSPTLDARVSVEKITPRLVNVFVPQLLAEGNIEARARLQGTLAAPTGRARLSAIGIRIGNDAASDLAAVDVQARAELNGDTAALDVHVIAGGDSSLSASGPIPLDAQGAANLSISGKLAVGLINPLLEARGMQGAGEIGIDATLKGPLADPVIDGAVTLTHGSLRDYARGISLTEISARLTGSQGTLQVEQFDAKASPGKISMSGSIGILQPKIPVDLKITAHNAQPITSSIVTANMDADIGIKGTARERLDVAGTVHLNRTDIGIPNSFPPDVAVLDVRRRGVVPVAQRTPVLVIGLDVALKAPNQILVQGRGLDAEMGGEIHIGGTTDEPQVSGSFELIRGSFTLASSKLNFTNGRVGFEGMGIKKTIDPTLDFTAQTALTDGTASLHISGFADSPKFEFSSSPVMEQDEILARLLFGENVSQLTALQAAEIGAALATLSGVGGGTSPLVKLQKSLGLDRLSVGSGNPTATSNGEPTGASIAAGRYVSKRIYVEGKQNSTGSSQVQVDVDITTHLKLQTRLGNGTAIQGTTPEDDPGSSIGLTYQFEY